MTRIEVQGQMSRGATRFCEIGAIRWLEIKPSMGYEGLAA